MDEVNATDQFGLRKVTYPVAFYLPLQRFNDLCGLLEEDGWYPLSHAGSLAAYQDKTPIIPFGNGVTGRRHVVLFQIGDHCAVTAHVDKSLLSLHEMNKRETRKFLKKFQETYERRLFMPVPAQVVLDLHSYPASTKSPYARYDMALLRVDGVTSERFLRAFKRALEGGGYKVGIVKVPRRRADLITRTKELVPQTEVALLEVNERFFGDLQPLGDVIGDALAEVMPRPRRGKIDNPAPAVLLTLLGGLLTGAAAGSVGALATHHLQQHQRKARREPTVTTVVGNPDEIEAAQRMYETFHDFEAREVLHTTLPDPKPPITVQGKLTHVVYWCSKWDKPNIRYIHDWERAHLLVGKDAGGHYWLYGKARVKEEGITDHPGPPTWQNAKSWSITPPKTHVFLGICEEIAVDKKPIKLKRTILSTDAKGERLYLAPLREGQRPTHPTQYRG